MYQIFFRFYQWGRERPVQSCLLAVLIVAFLFLLPFFLSGCATPGTYVLFAQNAKSDADMGRAITLRLPFENQPVGATIFCESKTFLVRATKLDDTHVRVRDPDGEERDLELPGDGAPVGLVTFWPEGAAGICGIAVQSPVGTEAYVMWRDFTLFMKRTGLAQARYRISDDVLDLHYPLTAEDKALLRKRSVPMEVADLLY